MSTKRPEVTSAITGYRYKLGDLFWKAGLPTEYFILTKILSETSISRRKEYVLFQLQLLDSEKLYKEFFDSGCMDEIFIRHQNHLKKNISSYFKGEPFQFTPDEKKIKWLSSPPVVWEGLIQYEDGLDNWV